MLSNFNCTQITERQHQIASPEKVEIIDKLLAIGTALSSSKNLDKLLELILSKSREITQSDAV